MLHQGLYCLCDIISAYRLIFAVSPRFVECPAYSLRKCGAFTGTFTGTGDFHGDRLCISFRGLSRGQVMYFFHGTFTGTGYVFLSRGQHPPRVSRVIPGRNFAPFELKMEQVPDEVMYFPLGAISVRLVGGSNRVQSPIITIGLYVTVNYLSSPTSCFRGRSTGNARSR